MLANSHSSEDITDGRQPISGMVRSMHGSWNAVWLARLDSMRIRGIAAGECLIQRCGLNDSLVSKLTSVWYSYGQSRWRSTLLSSLRRLQPPGSGHFMVLVHCSITLLSTGPCVVLLQALLNQKSLLVTNRHAPCELFSHTRILCLESRRQTRYSHILHSHAEVWSCGLWPVQPVCVAVCQVKLARAVFRYGIFRRRGWFFLDDDLGRSWA